jgi:beta-lactamase superfamily II metal-dependent hydrolase
MAPPRPLRFRLPALLAALVLTGVFAPDPAHAVYTNGKLQIIHLDANQGDAAVIITPGGQVALVDEGTNFTVGSSTASCAKVLAQLQDLGVTHVDLHFASHYHADHIGCLTSLNGITVDQGWDRAQSYSSGTYTSYVSYLTGKRFTLTKGRVFTLDSLSAHPVTITCVALSGDGISTSDENAKSVVLKVSYGEFDEVLGGDLNGNTGVEAKVGPQVGHVEVYKVHHHGSATSSYDEWLNATTPKVGVVSVGTGNTYGHPTVAALTRLHNHGTRTYWTQLGSGATPSPAWDKVANSQIRINAVWQPGGVDSILAAGIADTLTNSGTALDMTPPIVAVMAPNGGETLGAGDSVTITWSASDNVAVSTVDVDYSLDDGGNWTPLIVGVANSGVLGWRLPNALSSLAKVRVTAHDGAGNAAADLSNSDFTIADLTAPVVAVSAPNGGESFTGGTLQSVTWSASDHFGIDSVSVDYSLHGAWGPWVSIQHALANSGSVTWALPDSASDSALVRVTAFDHALNQGQDASDGAFQIGVSTAGVGHGPFARFALERPSPSPAYGAAVLRFSLASPAPTTVEVLDVRGRRVWRTRWNVLEPGMHSLLWGGSDEHGIPASPGVYFVRLTSGAHSRAVKLVLLR